MADCNATMLGPGPVRSGPVRSGGRLLVVVALQAECADPDVGDEKARPKKANYK